MDISFSAEFDRNDAEIPAFFGAVFSASEGPKEGAVIAGLVQDILREDAPSVFTAWQGATRAGSIIFTELTYRQDPRKVALLSPVAVKTDLQGQGLGQRLLQHGLLAMTAKGAEIALTYGDPNYYGKVGFGPVTTDHAAPPFKLSYPNGWLGQALSGGAWGPLKGPSSCVSAFHDPAYW